MPFHAIFFNSLFYFIFYLIAFLSFFEDSEYLYLCVPACSNSVTTLCVILFHDCDSVTTLCVILFHDCDSFFEMKGTNFSLLDKMHSVSPPHVSLGIFPLS